MAKKYLYFILILTCFTNCGGTKNAAKNPTINKTEIESKNYVTQLNKGIDFTAQGNEPTIWSLAINFDDSIYIKTEDGISLTFATNNCKRMDSETSILLSTQIKKVTLAINIFKENCTTQAQKTTLEYNNKTYTGCGAYLKNPALNNNWILYKIRNKFTDNYKPVPNMVINIDKNNFYGSDGINAYTGKIDVQGDKIFYKDLQFSKSKTGENEFTIMLKYQLNKNIASYYFKNDMLYLYLIDDSLLVFKKSK